MHAEQGLLVIRTNRQSIHSGIFIANMLDGIPETEAIAAGLQNVAAIQVCLSS